MVYDSIKKLVAYGVNTGLVEPEDEVYVTNRLLEVMKLDEYEEPEEIEEDTPLEEILKDLLDEAYASGVLEDNGIASRDLFDTKLMGCLVARPSEVIRAFMDHYAKSPVEATDFFYKFSPICTISDIFACMYTHSSPIDQSRQISQNPSDRH